MAKTNNLTDFLTDIADGIRTVEGSSAEIDPQDFRDRIEGLRSGGNATAAQILSPKTAYVGGKLIQGTMPTQAAKTITPTKSSQTAVAAGKYTTGAITVAAIPSDYIQTNNATATASDIKYGKTAYVNGSLLTGTHTEEGVSSEYAWFSGFQGSSSLAAPAGMRFRYCLAKVFPTLDNYTTVYLSSGFNIKSLLPTSVRVQKNTLITFDFEQTVSNYRIKKITISTSNCSATWLSPSCFYITPSSSGTPAFYITNVTWTSI